MAGLITNATLKALHGPLPATAGADYAEKGEKARLPGEVGYRAGPWKRFRWVIMKAEVTAQGTNRRCGG